MFLHQFLIRNLGIKSTNEILSNNHFATFKYCQVYRISLSKCLVLREPEVAVGRVVVVKKTLLPIASYVKPAINGITTAVKNCLQLSLVSWARPMIPTSVKPVHYKRWDPPVPTTTRLVY